VLLKIVNCAEGEETLYYEWPILKNLQQISQPYLRDRRQVKWSPTLLEVPTFFCFRSLSWESVLKAIIGYHRAHAKKLRTYSFVANVVAPHSEFDQEDNAKPPRQYTKLVEILDVFLPTHLARLANLRLNVYVFRVA